MKKGLIFDLDGVLTDTAKYHYLAWKELASSLGITIDLAFNEELKGISRMDSLERILAYGNQENRYSQAEKETFATEKNQAYVALLQQLTPADLLPGVAEFLADAKKHHLPCGVASASKNAPFILEKLGIADSFAVIVDPDSLTKGKPDPEIFLKAAEGLGISPAEAVAFEDAQAGVDGIKAAGMYAVAVVEVEPLKGADRWVHRLDELAVADLIKL